MSCAKDFTSLSSELCVASLAALISVEEDIDAVCTKSLSACASGLTAVVDDACVCAAARVEMAVAPAQRLAQTITCLSFIAAVL